MRDNAELSSQLETSLSDCRRQIDSLKEKGLIKVYEFSWLLLQHLFHFLESYRNAQIIRNSLHSHLLLNTKEKQYFVIEF